MKFKHTWETQTKLDILGYGEWVEEPDFADFIYENIHCKIIRIFNSGYFCGYCFLPFAHPWMGLDFGEIETEVHGGITYLEGNKVGFDAAHLDDMIPRTEYMMKDDPFIKKIKLKFKTNTTFIRLGIFNNSYKNMAFMIEECKLLAREINEVRIR